MNQYRFPERKGVKAALGLFLFATLYLARDTLVTSSLLGFYQAQFLMLGLLAAAGLVFLWWNRKELKAVVRDRRAAWMAVCAGIMLLPMICKGDYTLMYFSVTICLVFSIFLTFFMKLEEAAKYYTVIMAVLGVYSMLAAYVLRRLPDAGVLPVPVLRNQIGVEFYNFWLSFVPLEYVKTRNFGIFREPGVYQFFLILGLYLNHYHVVWERPWQMWTVSALLAATMVTTFATGGIIELALFCVIIFFDKKLYRSKWAWGVLAAVAVGIAVTASICVARRNALYWEVYDMLIGKFTYQEESIGDRVGSVVVNLELFFRGPVFGARIAEVLYAIANNTTSTLIMFACFGAVGGIVHVAGWVALVWKKEQRLWVNLGLLLVLLMSFNTQNLIADLYFWLFPMMALTERLLPGLNIPKRRAREWKRKC